MAAKPEHVGALNNLANSLNAQGRLDAAFELYQKALQIDPNHAATHYNLGKAIHQQGKL